jgi:mitotic spindle assembly checkpoint protein MAD2B
MIESQLGQMHLGDEISFAVIIELKDDIAPTHSGTKDPPPWIPAVTQHTTSGTGEKAELHMIRAVNTGIINLSLGVQESSENVERQEKKKTQKKKTRVVNDEDKPPSEAV